LIAHICHPFIIYKPCWIINQKQRGNTIIITISREKYTKGHTIGGSESEGGGGAGVKKDEKKKKNSEQQKEGTKTMKGTITPNNHNTLRLRSFSFVLMVCWFCVVVKTKQKKQKKPSDLLLGTCFQNTSASPMARHTAADRCCTVWVCALDLGRATYGVAVGDTQLLSS
jgi:hypothetical protein